MPTHKCDIYSYLGLSAEKIADKVINYDTNNENFKE